jgi:predicted dienelactone hydrolase
MNPAFVPGDALPGAPELAARGPHAVGVTTIAFPHPQRVDVLASLAAGRVIRSTRMLRAEVWYPSALRGRTSYHGVLLRSDAGSAPRPQRYRFPGRALRDAPPERLPAPAPLVIASHGYPGSRLHFSWLGENLASKGYAVLALDHPDSTLRDQGDVLSSLRNRPLDLAWALQQAPDVSRDHPLLRGVWDARRTALVGFSMGGMGVMAALGAGFDPDVLALPAFDAPMWRALLSDVALDAPLLHEAAVIVRERVQAAVLLAPWGGHAIWSDRALQRVRTPLFIASGSDDDVAVYAGTRRLFAGVTHAERMLLTFAQARHNIGANPPPPRLLQASSDDWWRFADPVWDSRRILSLLQHHVSAFLGVTLLGLPLERYHQDAAAAPPGEAWPGYPPRSTLGVRMEIAAATAESAPA